MKRKIEGGKDGKVYDFTHLKEEVTIGVFVESDLSKTVANYIHQHTDDLGMDEFARGLFRTGKVTMTDDERDVMIRNIQTSKLLVSQKQAVLEMLKAK